MRCNVLVGIGQLVLFMPRYDVASFEEHVPKCTRRSSERRYSSQRQRGEGCRETVGYEISNAQMVNEGSISVNVISFAKHRCKVATNC